ncbi:phage virion morphogenesis protein [Novosphingobium sp. HII-3]|uniref:phage virion morphogenesis protein n=1 Tax=Novosphingobium sp. HII-3 TaxID=2075565 RepID=UPI000CDAF0D2|nr:phage virion morphogenesis protein [Novosphingobium sp. HII-3]
MTEDLAELERIAGGLLKSLSSGERRAVMRKMARALAISQRERITAQREPDGSAFAARKAKQPPITGRGTACFLYPSGGSGEPRRVIMKSFTWSAGRMMTGFDIEAGAIRSFEFDKIVKHLPVPEEHRNASAGKLRRRGGLRRRAMFRRLASSRFLKTGTDDQSFWVGFTGKVSQMATVHQYGLRDKPSLRAKAVPYAKRELLGATTADRDKLLDALYEHLASAV